MGLVDDEVLLLGPGGLLDLGVEVVVPTFAALLADAALQVLGDHRPALRAILVHELDDLRAAAGAMLLCCSGRPRGQTGGTAPLNQHE